MRNQGGQIETLLLWRQDCWGVTGKRLMHAVGAHTCAATASVCAPMCGLHCCHCCSPPSGSLRMQGLLPGSEYIQAHSIRTFEVVMRLSSRSSYVSVL